MKIFLRVLHGLAVVVTVIGLSLLGFAAMLYVFLLLGVGSEPEMKDWRVLGLAFVPWIFAAMFVGLGVVAINKKLSWKALLPGFLFVGGLMLYLSWDDPEKPSLADIGPRVTESDEGYRTVMWMSQDSPFSRLKEDGVLIDISELRLPSELKDWPEHVRQHREEFLWAWDQDVVGRGWVDAVNAKPPAGIWPQKWKDPIIDFHPVRAGCDVRMARALLLATENRRDEAVQSILPFISAWQHIQRTGPCMLNGMIACVSLKRGYSIIAEILKMGGISTETKDLLVKILHAAPPTHQSIRNAFMGEQEVARGALDLVSETAGLPSEEEDGESGGVFAKAVSRKIVRLGYVFVFNRNRTEKEQVSRLWKASALAEARQMAELARFSEMKSSRWRLKNAVGIKLVDLGTPAYTKALENIWQTEDLRLALLKQLEKP